MGIESNKEAVAMMKNALGSIENRFREAYNKGYKDGLRDGASQVTAKIVGKILEEAEAEPTQDQHVQHVESVKDETGRWVRVGQWEWEHHTDTTHFGKAKGESITTNKVEAEPQTDCAWGKCE